LIEENDSLMPIFEARVGADQPLRTIREIANAALADLTGQFAAVG
jgi:hypothetical protein